MPRRLIKRIGTGIRRLVNPSGEELLAQRTAKKQARMRKIILAGQAKRESEAKKKKKLREGKKGKLESEETQASIEEMKERLQERYGKF